jgi:hypothetical protein
LVALTGISLCNGCAWHDIEEEGGGVFRFGRVRLVWQYSTATKKLRSELTLPLGSVGTFHSPTRLVQQDGLSVTLRHVTESGVQVWSSDLGGGGGGLSGGGGGVQESAEDAAGAAVLTNVQSGRYVFEAQYA